MRYADAPAGDEADDAVDQPEPRPRVPQPRTAPEPDDTWEPDDAPESADPPERGDPADPSGPPPAGPRRPGVDHPALTDREREILAFERRWWRHAGAKEQAIRDAFELSATRYYQILNGLLDNPAALAAEPVLVARLRRLRAARSRGRGR